ncbi:hypothetical protein D3C81_1736640 [compost metagenome]
MLEVSDGLEEAGFTQVHLIAFSVVQCTEAPVRVEHPVLQAAGFQTGGGTAYVAAHVDHRFRFHTTSDFHHQASVNVGTINYPRAGPLRASICAISTFPRREPPVRAE